MVTLQILSFWYCPDEKQHWKKVKEKNNLKLEDGNHAEMLQYDFNNALVYT